MKHIVIAAMALSLGLASACSSEMPVSVQNPSHDACAGVAEAGIHETVAELRAQTESVERLYEQVGPKTATRPVGALVRVRATRGMSPQWLGRALECNADGDARGSSPLALAGVRSEISPTSTGFNVEIRSNNPTVAAEVLRRASAGTW